MNRDRAKELLPVIQAFAEGKIIEGTVFTRESRIKQQWKEQNNPIWANDTDYRIKPEPEVIYVTRFLNGDFIVNKTPTVPLGATASTKKFIEVIDNDKTEEIPEFEGTTAALNELSIKS